MAAAMVGASHLTPILRPSPLHHYRCPACWVLPQNHLEERLLDQAQARALYTPLFWGSFT